MNTKILFLAPILSISALSFGQDAPPNILVIITDQHSGTLLTQRGYDNMLTPGIDKIADQGVTFTRSYCTYPVCTASRKSFMTGMMPSKATPTNYPSIAGVLAEKGYETAYLGKWHVGSTDMDDVKDWHGFQSYNDLRNDSDISQRSTDFLKQDHTKPFFLITSFLNPHDCCELARNIAGDNDSYHDGPVEEQMDTAFCPALPYNFAIPENEAEGVSARRNQDPGDEYWDTNPYKGWTESMWRHYMYGYDRLVEKVDAHIEEVYDELESQGLLENTIIIYTSDHGDGHGSHQWTQKKNFYEEVINIPFIVSWKGKTKAGVIDEETLVSNGLDLYPTILKMAGIEIPDYLPGENLSASFLTDAGDAAPVTRDYVVSEIDQSVYKSNTPGSFIGRMVVTKKFKYFLFDHGANKEQLFDLESDPGELNPVTYDPAYHDELMACRAMLKEWVTITDDDFDVDAAIQTVKYDVKRLNNAQPIITQEMFSTLGAAEDGVNMNGPSAIRIPDWISPENRANPTAEYYLYFAHHGGEYIRMAWASEIEGPWHLYQVGTATPIGDRGVLDLGDHVINLENGIVIPNNHLASPDVHVDNENQRIILYFHSGSSTYVDGVEVNAQLSYVSFSPYGLEFYNNIQPVILGNSYFRVFEYGDNMYALSNDGTPYKALDVNAPWAAPVGFDFTKKLWDNHPNNPFQADITGIDGISSDVLRVRHTAVRKVGDELQVFYSRRGDLMENIQMSTIDLSVGDWTKWDASYPPYQILQSAPGWEGGDLSTIPSETSSAPEDVNQLRDPYVLEDNDGSLYLFYSGRGEDAIGLAQLFEAHMEENSVNPLKDAFVKGGSDADNNFGTAAELEVNNGTDPNLNRKFYAQFDLSQLTEVDQALLRLYASSEIACQVTAYEVSNTSWGEESITWNNAPDMGTAIATTQIGTDKQYYEWDITDYAKSNLGNAITIGFYDESASNKAVSFSSKEGENTPELKIISTSSEYKYPPATPSPLFASAISQTEIILNWTDNSMNEDGFKIEKKEEGGTFTEIASLDANITSYSESGLQSSTKYIYRVLAYNAEGNSDYSNEASATTFSDNMLTSTYSITEDTYVRGGEYANINYSTETDLIVKTGSKEDFFRKTLIKIDLNNENLQSHAIGRAVLKLYANRTGDCTIVASEIDDNWTESIVTWATAPVSGSDISSSEITSADTYYEWDITNYLKSQLNQDGIISVCLDEYTGANVNVYFNSKEAADHHPELVLSIDDSYSSLPDYTREFKLNIYPNPASNVLNVATAEAKIDKLAIYNLTGQILLVQHNVENQARFNIENLEKGIYLLKAEGEFGTYTRKFIKTQ
ncbi:MAG: sulfatase-like hydrolase/transferase [Bacteroidales bacterium]|nr:sulfatase-like hydrolase/transferase [Bacteroidales bacterium]MCF8390618.1 sulfatase-like hydrolase/transferase [Bacteroidales bacterium]